MSLSIRGMNVGYGKNKITLRDINLPTIEEGALVAVVGANAVGKSTLLKSLACIHKYDGDACFKGESLATMERHRRMRIIGYLPQALPQATTMVAYELVYSGVRAACGHLSIYETEQRIENVFNRLGIFELSLKKMSEMSGGQRQMIGLAQVLVRQPELLLLDEPTSALDLHWQLNVLRTVRDETSKHRSIAFVASHDLNLALRFCDLLLVLVKGKVLEMGPPHEVLTSKCLSLAYGVEGRVETCSLGYPIVLADRPCSI